MDFYNVIILYLKVKEACPTCGHVCGVIIGDQPDGVLDVAKIRTSLTGYEGHQTIALSYFFPPGKQGVILFFNVFIVINLVIYILEKDNIKLKDDLSENEKERQIQCHP